MLFDKFAGCVERHMPELMGIMMDAKLFTFEGLPQDFLKERKGFHDGFDPELFHLPFKTVAVEDPGGLVIFQDKGEDVLGLDQPRVYIEVQPVLQDMDRLVDVEHIGPEAIEGMKILDEKFPGAMTVNMGVFEKCELFPGTDKFKTTFTPYRQVQLAKKAGIFFELHPSLLHDAGQQGVLNATVALEELAMLSRPKDFTMETSPKKRPKVRKGTIPRAHQRSTFTILEPSEDTPKGS